MRIKLTHNCGLPGAKGYIGEIVECDDAVGQRILEIKGGFRVDTSAPIETAEAEPAPETTEAAKPMPKRRSKLGIERDDVVGG